MREQKQSVSIGERIAERAASLIDIRRFRIPFDTPWDRDKFRSEIAALINQEVVPLVEALQKIEKLYSEHVPMVRREKFLDNQVRQAHEIAVSALAQAGQEPPKDL